MSSIVVLGYGNPLRRDDGIGWRVAEAIGDRWQGNLTVRTAQQLVPEWAAELAVADVAFIVGACVTSPRVRLRRLTRRASEPALHDSHTPAPTELIGLAHVVYGRCASTYLVQVPAEDFAFGDVLSTAAAAGVQHAIELLDARLARLLSRQQAMTP